MMPGMESSFSGVGNLRDEMNTKLRDKADNHEIVALSNKMESFMSQIEHLQSQIERLQNQVEGLQSRAGNY
jgi:predicted  nucleic acid-binding Zn-ribbon protein